MKKLLLLSLIATMLGNAPASAAITSYQVVFRPFLDDQGKVKAAIRQFSDEKGRHYLVLDPYRLITATATSPDFSRPVSSGAWRDTPFALLQEKATEAPFPLQNDGLVAAPESIAGYFLTIDLCPTAKPLDRDAFNSVIDAPSEGREPTPVGIAVSGLWLKTHQADLRWLLQQEKNGGLSITWINHSLSHPYDPAAPLERNFLLTPGVDLRREVLEMEKMLIERHLPVSPFFRFPGLVSNERLMGELKTMSLIPLGSDAWLAKKENPRPGSIVLVHGNGNEPEGIRLLREFISAGKGEKPWLPLTALPVPAAGTAKESR
ncbi:MAG: hypothetical protein PHY31_01855 [Smithellaceae bacterium]|nr:hypothetical protein [Smithellaceae bacterium]